MDRWILFAVLSMIFAGMTSVVAKQGLTGISGELGLVIRTGFVALFTAGFAAIFVDHKEFKQLSTDNISALAISAVTTTFSWIFYYKALKEGDVATVAIIDKGSIVIAIVLAWLLLGERITWRIAVGSLFILTGLIVVAKK